MAARRPRPYRSAWAGILTWNTFLAALAMGNLINVIWPAASWPLPPFPRLASALLAAAAATLAGVLAAVRRRSPRARLRRELLAEVRLRESGTWVNRELGLAFSVWHAGRIRSWLIAQIARADIASLEEDGPGEGVLAVTTYMLMPVSLEILRDDDAVLADLDARTVRALDRSRSMRDMRRAIQMGRRTGLGMHCADPAEVARLITALRASERTGGRDGQG